MGNRQQPTSTIPVEHLRHTQTVRRYRCTYLIGGDENTMTDILSMLILYFSLFYIGYLHGKSKK